MASRVLLQVLSEKIKIEEIRKRFQDCIDHQSKMLVLDNLNLAAFPDSFTSDIKQGKLSNLQVLSFNTNNLKNLPPELRHLKKLEELNAENNQINSLPPSIGELTNLQRLHFYSNSLSSLPSEFGQLTSLTRLFLENNQITSLPSEIGQLTNLVWLSLNNNLIQFLPPEIGRLTRLGWLSLENNRLEAIPPEIGFLTCLQSLSVYDNLGLAIIPRNMILLTQLQDLRANSYFRLPKELFTLSDATKAKEIVEFLTMVIKPHNLRLDIKGHWEPDESALQCTKCSETFTFTLRRHHCRLCGRLFCKKCCWMTLDIPVMNSVRVCDLCGNHLSTTTNPVEYQITSRIITDYGLTEDDEALSEQQKKQKLESQLKEINKAILDAINQKAEAEAEAALHPSEEGHQNNNINNNNNLDKSKTDFLQAQERLVEDLALLQMRLLQELEGLERRPQKTVFSYPPSSVNAPTSNQQPATMPRQRIQRQESGSRKRAGNPPRPASIMARPMLSGHESVVDYAEDGDDINDDDEDDEEPSHHVAHHIHLQSSLPPFPISNATTPPPESPVLAQRQNSYSSLGTALKDNNNNNNNTTTTSNPSTPSTPSPATVKLGLTKGFQGSGSLRSLPPKHRLEIGSRPLVSSK
eukprot:TRINITY_DN775_c0_g1_i1.p1 TRINITY_DN775_c0_g1~~TRINITY_DN775_c0_g1_i1.p1  ORF type:complete len:636 (+),score=158.36 TRINITY_DN775_c0_g1_i1:62-1969(+)